MTDIIWFILTTSGMSYGITRSVAFKRIREFFTARMDKEIFSWTMHHIFNCPQCNGFYCGMISWFILSGYTSIYDVISAAFSGSIVAFFVYLLMDKLKEK